MSPLWQILTSTAVGALISGIVALLSVRLTQGHARIQADADREHDRQMRALEKTDRDDREFTALIHELTPLVSQWSNVRRAAIPQIKGMSESAILQWLNSDSGREIREHAIRINELLIRSQLMCPEKKLHDAIENAFASFQDLDSGGPLGESSRGIETFERKVFQVAEMGAISRRKTAAENREL